MQQSQGQSCYLLLARKQELRICVNSQGDPESGDSSAQLNIGLLTVSGCSFHTWRIFLLFTPPPVLPLPG